MKLKIEEYQLFLFDLDGLLIDTDPLHYQAYVEFLKKRSCNLSWTLEEYLKIAQESSSALKEAIYELFPELLAQEPKWDVLYAEKKQCYLEILKNSKLSLMPGIETFLRRLLKREKTIGVVTYSTGDEVEIIKNKVPLLNKIHNWVVRDDYHKQRPDPQCYKIAIDRLAFTRLAIIGFEHTARGLIALLGTSATPVLVSKQDYPQLEAYRGRYSRVSHFDEIEFVGR